MQSIATKSMAPTRQLASPAASGKSKHGSLHDPSNHSRSITFSNKPITTQKQQACCKKVYKYNKGQVQNKMSFETQGEGI
jgi:hypothetical protein